MVRSSRVMPSNPGAPRRPRDPLPTLTEDDFRSQGERMTMPPPVPIGELVDQMMGVIDGEHPEAPPPPAAPKGPAEAGARITIEDVPFEAEILDEIGAAYLARLGSRAHVPFACMAPEEALRVPLDHWAGFILSFVDGRATVDDILDASSMPEIEVLRLLCELREVRIIDLRAASSRAAGGS
jgi:hypothetical protein